MNNINKLESFKRVIIGAISYISACWLLIQVVEWVNKKYLSDGPFLSIILLVAAIIFPFYLFVIIFLSEINGRFSLLLGITQDNAAFIHKNNMPVFNNKFIGRKKELTSIIRAINNQKTVTLVGPGGVGKTRLSIEAVRKVFGKETVYFFSFSEVNEIHQILIIISLVVGAGIEAKASSMNDFVKQFRDFKSLFIFDNCEQCTAHFAALTQAFLHYCPGIKIIITSRIPISIENEFIIEILPFNRPENINNAFLIFLQAYGNKRHKFTKNEINYIYRICSLLDGNPFSIIMIASRAKFFELELILENINTLITSDETNTNYPEHQRSIFTCINWSYKLLNDEQRNMLNVMAYFKKNIPLKAVTKIISESLPEVKIINILSNLVSHHFAFVIKRGHLTYYQLPNIVEQFIQKYCKLDAGFIEYKKLHAKYYSNCAVEMESKIYGKGSDSFLLDLDFDYMNYELAMNFSLEDDNVSIMIDFFSLYWYWFLRGKWSATIPIFSSLHNNALSDKQYCKFLLASGTMSWANGDYDLAKGNLLASIKVSSGINDDWLRGQALHILGHVYHQTSNYDDAIDTFNASLSLLKSYNGYYWVTLIQNDIADVNLDVGNLECALTVLKPLIKLAKSDSDMHGLGNTYMHIGNCYLIKNKKTRALFYIIKAIRIFNRFSFYRGLGTSYKLCGDIYFNLGYKKRAYRNYKEALLLQQKTSHLIGMIRTIESISNLLIIIGQYELALRLLGKTDYERTMHKLSQQKYFKDIHDRNLEYLKTVIGNEYAAYYHSLTGMKLNDISVTVMNSIDSNIKWRCKK